ncbi:MAG: hypothetical protein RLZ32_2504 [Gemmatimonadota bacterium]
MRYPVPAAAHRVAQVIDRSRFLATVAPAPTVADAQAVLRAVREEFPDATHHCWAYVVGPPGSTGQVGMSDDGEPHGTAGRPMLTVLLHGGVGDVVAVVTRYYGGTKLGTGGLVKAYGGAVQEALATLPRRDRVDAVALTVRVGYAAIGAVQPLWALHEAAVREEAFAAEATYLLAVPRDRVDALVRAVTDATRGTAQVTRG